MTHDNGILFLCVANSARSQMAEGLARSLAPEGLSVFSAGSTPTQVRPEAILAMAEIGVDLSAHRSKGLDAVPLAQIRTVVTLCGEEVCPTLAADVERLHWPIPDPAATEGDEATVVDAFRAARDDLRSRIQALFTTWRQAGEA